MVESEYVPARQFVQDADEIAPVPAENLPMEHAVHCEAPVEEYVPPAQLAHVFDVSPYEVLNVPDEHAVQELEPVFGE